MAKVILMQGLPASGKTTWARQYQATRPNVKRVNKDDLRSMIDDSVFSKEREKEILQVRDTIILYFIKKGYDIIVDDTNFSSKHENRIKSIVPKNTEVVTHFIDIPLEECIKRDNEREYSVGSKVIRDMYNKYIANKSMTREEKTDIWLQTKKKKKEFVPYNPNLPDCIICDIDGTVAEHIDRSPYDYTKVLTDKPIKPVINLMRILNETPSIQTIFVSGREGTVQCHNDTYEWLVNHHLDSFFLYMRPQDDYRKDVVIKKEIYERYIKGYYNVLAVFDDRNQTVKGWRDLGLLCLQVEEGDF